jgi:hypothetical protein
LAELFTANHHDESNRQILQSGYGNQGLIIDSILRSLIRDARLKPALNAPNSEYNRFISTWNNGTGDLGKSFNAISEFWRLLSSAKPELQRLLMPQPGPGPQPGGPKATPAEVVLFQKLRSETNDLYAIFKSCAAAHSAPAEAKIKEHVRVIGQLLNDGSLSQSSKTALTKAKAEWAQFTAEYKNGARIDKPTLSQLGYFVNFTNIACSQILG